MTMINKNCAPKVGIIDLYKLGISPEDDMDINSDGIPDLCHGHLVEGVYMSTGNHKKLPKVQRFKQDMRTDVLEKNANKIIETNKHKQNKINWINFSLHITDSFKSENLAGINAKNIHKKENQEIILSPENLEEDYIKEINILYKLKKHVKQIYTIAGNDGKDCFNIYSLVEGIKTVGGLNKKQKPHIYSGNNSLVKDWAPFSYEGKIVYKKGKPIGYDISPLGEKGDGVADIKFNDKTIKISGTNKPDNKIYIEGTSFSAPYKLGKDILKEQELQ